MGKLIETEPTFLRWDQIFERSSLARREQELISYVLSDNKYLPSAHNIIFPETREGAWGIVVFDDQFVYKLIVGKRREGRYEGFDADQAKLVVDEYHAYAQLLLEYGIAIPGQRNIRVLPNPLDKNRAYLFEVQERIPGVNGLNLLRPGRTEDTLTIEAQHAVFEQAFKVLLPILRHPKLKFGLDPHPANFIYDPRDLTKAPPFIDLLPPRLTNGFDYQENVRRSAQDPFYNRRLHLLYEPAGLVKYLYNAFTAAEPTLRGDFKEITLSILQQNGVLYDELERYFYQADIGERMRDWGYMQRIFRALGRPERARSFNGNSTHLGRLPYDFTPKQVISDRRLDELNNRSKFWIWLIREYLGDLWLNTAASNKIGQPQLSINMIMNQKRAFNLQTRIQDFEGFHSFIAGGMECVITIGHPLTVRVFDKIKEICSQATFPVTIIVNKSPSPNISRDLATAVSRGEIRFILDDDCYVPEETFRGLYYRLVQGKEFIAVGASSVNPDGKRHKPEETFPSDLRCEGLVVPGIHGMAFMIKGHYMDKYPIPPRIGKRGDWLPFFSLLQNEDGICIYDLSLPSIQHQFDVADNNLSIGRRRLAGLHATLSMMHTLYETGVLLKSGSRADLYLREHYLGETLAGVQQGGWLPTLWENLRAICSGSDLFSYNSQQIYDRMTVGIDQSSLGIRNSAILRWASELFLSNRVLAEKSKALMFELTSNQLLPPFHKFNL